MNELTALRTIAACTTVLAAAMVAANVNSRVTAAGFVIFIVASVEGFHVAGKPVLYQADGTYKPSGGHDRFSRSIAIFLRTSPQVQHAQLKSRVLLSDPCSTSEVEK